MCPHLSLSALPDLHNSSNESGIKTTHTAIDSPQQLVKRSVYDFLWVCQLTYRAEQGGLLTQETETVSKKFWDRESGRYLVSLMLLECTSSSTSETAGKGAVKTSAKPIVKTDPEQLRTHRNQSHWMSAHDYHLSGLPTSSHTHTEPRFTPR